MKLTDLKPRWVAHGGDGISDRYGNPVPRREGVGIMFDCPSGCGEDVFLYIDPPLDGGPPLEGSGPAWKRTGDTFENLTLTPSIQRVGGCGWHGFVTLGEVKGV